MQISSPFTTHRWDRGTSQPLQHSPSRLAFAASLGWAAVILWNVAALSAEGPPAKKSEPVLLNQLAIFAGQPDWVASVAFSPDGKMLAVGSYETIALCDPAAKSESAKLKTKTGFVRAVAYSRDGTLLASGSYQTV